MSKAINTNRKNDDRNWICDLCGITFSSGDGSIEAGFGFCNSFTGEDSKSKNKLSEKYLNDFKSKEFTDLEYENKLSSITINELIKLKEKYDNAFRKYWSSGGGSPKFQVVSLEEFIKRLKTRDFFDKYGRTKI